MKQRVGKLSIQELLTWVAITPPAAISVLTRRCWFGSYMRQQIDVILYFTDYIMKVHW